MSENTDLEDIQGKTDSTDVLVTDSVSFGAVFFFLQCKMQDGDNVVCISVRVCFLKRHFVFAEALRAAWIYVKRIRKCTGVHRID